jgi:SAM-dependent methyltransferase
MGPETGATAPVFRIAGKAFPLAERILRIGGTPVRLAEVPYTSGRLDQVVEARGLRERDWPYWLEDWPATYALAEVLCGEDPASFREPCLDLGCGSGFMAAFLRARFGIHVFSCDFNADACRLASLNAAAARGPGGTGGRNRVFCADMGRFPSRAAFGLVLGGEMLYARENQGPILAFLSAHLAPGGTAWFADPGRSAAEGFAGAADASGFAATSRTIDSQAAGRNVDVYKVVRKSAQAPSRTAPN